MNDPTYLKNQRHILKNRGNIPKLVYINSTLSMNSSTHQLCLHAQTVGTHCISIIAISYIFIHPNLHIQS